MMGLYVSRTLGDTRTDAMEVIAWATANREPERLIRQLYFRQETDKLEE